MAKKPKHAVLLIPGLRGNFGSWTYYSCLMPLGEINRRVDYATKIHTQNKPLSDMIQRSLEGNRADNIAGYIKTNPDRFFSALVIAVYGGSPDWLEVGNFKATDHAEAVKEISQQAKDSIGFLRLTGSEEMFAVDGQHRVAGIRRAIENDVDVDDELLPVLLIGHRTTVAGMERTRRLFTTLNKLAVPVKKSDIIALDEDDAMAITVRRLVEDHPKFLDPRIAISTAQQIPSSNSISLTTIGNLYDLLKLLFMYSENVNRDTKLRFNRPTDTKLAGYHKVAIDFFAALEEASPPFKSYFSQQVPTIDSSLRSSAGGHLLFRPIGLEVVTRAAIEISREQNITINKAAQYFSILPMQLTAAPFEGVIWDSNRNVVITRGKLLAVRLAAYMLGNKPNEEELLADLKHAHGLPPSNTSLPLPTPVR